MEKQKLKDKEIWNCNWSLDKMKFKYPTGDIIEGCEEWNWSFRDSDVELKVSEFIKELKEGLFDINLKSASGRNRLPSIILGELEVKIKELAEKKFGKGLIK